MTAGAAGTDASVAYVCLWAAVTCRVRTLACEAGVRPQFSLRRNGTLRTRREGDVKLPDIIPAQYDLSLAMAI